MEEVKTGAAVAERLGLEALQTLLDNQYVQAPRAAEPCCTSSENTATGTARRPSARAPRSGCGKLRAFATHSLGADTMELTLDSLQAEVLKLSAADRTRLLDVLLDSIDQDEEVEREWEQIADERDAELDSGSVAAVDGPSVLARLRAKHVG